MLDTLQGLGLLTTIEIVGPVVLALAFIYGVYHTRRRRGLQPQSRPGTIYAQDRD